MPRAPVTIASKAGGGERWLCAFTKKQAIFFSLLRRHEAVTVACSHTHSWHDFEAASATEALSGLCKSATMGMSKYCKRAQPHRARCHSVARMLRNTHNALNAAYGLRGEVLLCNSFVKKKMQKKL